MQDCIIPQACKLHDDPTNNIPIKINVQFCNKTTAACGMKWRQK